MRNRETQYSTSRQVTAFAKQTYVCKQAENIRLKISQIVLESLPLSFSLTFFFSFSYFSDFWCFRRYYRRQRFWIKQGDRSHVKMNYKNVDFNQIKISNFSILKIQDQHETSLLNFFFLYICDVYNFMCELCKIVVIIVGIIALEKLCRIDYLQNLILISI